MPQALLFMIVLVVIAIVYFAVRRAHSGNVINANKYQDAWKDVEKVGDLITLYLDMVTQHGPDSQIAKAFRFGVENDRLWEKDAPTGLKSFIEIISYYDDALRRNKKLFKWS